MLKSNPLRLNSELCCVCGQNSCQEAIDHCKIRLSDLKSKIDHSGEKNGQLEKLKANINNLYRKVKKQFNDTLNNDLKKVQQWLNQFYYRNYHIHHLGLLCQLKQNDYTHLPNKKIIKILSNLNHPTQLIQHQNIELMQISQDIENFIKQFNVSSVISALSQKLGYENIVEKSLPFLNMGKSMSQISNPEETQDQVLKTHKWKNINIKHNTKVIDVSNKMITDEDMMRQLPILNSFKHIQVLEIRNNRISLLGCKLIVNNLLHLKELDIRGNQIGDLGVANIVNGMANLKSLMISETGVGDSSAKQVARNLHNLQLLWAEHNLITGQGAHQLVMKPKLRILSLAGNRIQEHNFEQLKSIFKNKGYFVL